MKKIFTGILVIILAMSYVTCVFGYGTNEVFSFEIWLENLASFGDIASTQDFVEIWQDDTMVDGGDLATGGEDAERTSFFDKVIGFFEEMLTFFRRLWDTVLLIVEIAVDVFANLGKLLPWNSTVPKEVVFGV